MPPERPRRATQPTRTEVRANLAELQKRINANPRARRTFLDDPAGVLIRAGLDLPADRQRALEAFISKQQTIGRVSGATILPGANPAATEVEVTIKIKF